MTLVVAVVLVVVSVAAVVTYLAGRLDRLQARLEAAAAALDAQLVRRSAAAEALAGRVQQAHVQQGDVQQGELAPAAELTARLHAAAAQARNASAAARSDAENDLSRAVLALLDGVPAGVLAADGTRQAHLDLVAAATRAALARRFHNEAVRELRSLRGGVVPRVLRLGDRVPLPPLFEVDEEALTLPPPEESPGADTAAV